MSKYTNTSGEKEVIIKTDPISISNNLKNSLNEFSIDKNKYNVLEYTEDYMKNLINTVEKVNTNWNNLLNIAITYQDEINYKDEVNYQGINNSIEYTPLPETKKGKVNTTSDYLNVRSSPNGNLISSIAPGTEVEILEDDVDGWTKVRVGGLEAYVCSRYITPDTPLEVIDTKIVNTTSLNINNYPNGNIINTLPYNSNVQLLAESHNGWTKILYDGKIAYVKSNEIR